MEDRILIAEISESQQNVVLAGRVVAVRRMKSYSFIDVADASGKIQGIIPAGDDITVPVVGDVILVKGSSTLTKSGQLSVECHLIETLAPGNSDVANAYKNKAINSAKETHSERSLRLMVDEDLKKMVKARSLFHALIREHFIVNGFMEVDTPTLSYSHFAGTANIFETKSRTLERNLYLRGTLEDYLKQLVVAGFEKVFEIGDCFRNESPALIEFTMLEATWAYARSEQMLALIQSLITILCERLPDELVDRDMKQAFSQKIEVKSFWGVLEEYFGSDIRQFDMEKLSVLTKKEGYSFGHSDNHEYELAKFGYDIIKRKLSKEFVAPTFVGRFPDVISPLAKGFHDGTGEADRGYGFFKGQRLFEVVEESSDYQEQLIKFQSQEDRAVGNGRTFKHDDLLVSLGYGCPPMAGLGFNINRVLAVLLGVTRTSDIMAFPLTSSALPL